MARRTAKKRGRTAKQRGRPQFKATKPLRLKVQQLVACGMSEDDVARAIGCSTPTLRQHFAEELLTGRAKKRAEVISMLFETAAGGNVSAQKHLEQMTKLASLAEGYQGDAPRKPAPARAAKLGKKDEAAAVARVIADSDDVYAPPPPPKPTQH